MEYIVRVWRENETTKYYEYGTIREAVEFADFSAEYCKRIGAEFDVAIYKKEKDA